MNRSSMNVTSSYTDSDEFLDHQHWTKNEADARIDRHRLDISPNGCKKMFDFLLVNGEI